VSGSNQVILKIKGAWQGYNINSDTSTVTVAPTTPTGPSTTLTINGGSTPTLATIRVYDANGTRQATLRVSIKTQNNKILDLYPVTDSNNNIVGSVPNPADVSTELQGIFGTYANLLFTINAMPTANIHYDLNGDGMLNDGFGSGSESQVISTYITNNGGVQGDIWASYVKDINPHRVEGFTTLCGIAIFVRNNSDSTGQKRSNRAEIPLCPVFGRPCRNLQLILDFSLHRISIEVSPPIQFRIEWAVSQGMSPLLGCRPI
jgi:hypothetical protein